MSMNPWINPDCTYVIIQLLIGSNSLSKLEVVSALNSFNLGHEMYAYYCYTRTEKYNPKVYLGAVQSMSTDWNLDEQDPTKVDEKWASNGQEKSGSWPNLLLKIC